MNITLISPAAIQSANGNYTTASRWKKILQTLGHQVALAQHYSGTDCDVMIALHAWRSADAIHQFKSKHPDKPLIVALTGTDIYRFIHSHPQQTLSSIALADHLIGLHQLVNDAIPAQYRHKLRVIFQASSLTAIRNKKHRKNFKLCVAGHLRDEKDPLRPAYAVRALPRHSKIYIAHYGKAHTRVWAQQACAENAKNRRYRWYGEISQPMLRIKFSQAKLMLLPSRMEGGANIISEAVMADLPVIASDIAGSVGLLGRNYPGYYACENTQELRRLLLRCERDHAFYQTLVKHCRALRYRFTHHHEQRAWQRLLCRVSQNEDEKQ